MTREAEIKELLMSNAIHLIAQGGFEKATTIELAHSGNHSPDLKMNEAYIYRLFGSKEALYEATFFRLDHELFYAFRHGAETVGGFGKDSRHRLYQFFFLAWQFLLGNEERCRFYVRYYYSIYFKGHSLASHKKIFEGIVAEMTPLFKEEADVVSILHSVFTAFLDFGIRVYNGELEDSDINRPHVFNVLYCMMATYFKEEAKTAWIV